MRISYIILMISGAALLTGCGIKPDYVDPPSGENNNTYPAAYPNPDTLKK